MQTFYSWTLVFLFFILKRPNKATIRTNNKRPQGDFYVHEKVKLNENKSDATK